LSVPAPHRKTRCEYSIKPAQFSQPPVISRLAVRAFIFRLFLIENSAYSSSLFSRFWAMASLADGVRLLINHRRSREKD
jgi:hypothetical protein